MKKSCVGCKYNSCFGKKPCRTGAFWSIYYSGECFQYKPSLKTKLKKWLKRRSEENETD